MASSWDGATSNRSPTAFVKSLSTCWCITPNPVELIRRRRTSSPNYSKRLAAFFKYYFARALCDASRRHCEFCRVIAEPATTTSSLVHLFHQLTFQTHVLFCSFVFFPLTSRVRKLTSCRRPTIATHLTTSTP